MKLIVGLGNPGKEYNNTRHNVGFMCIDEVARHFNVNFDSNKFSGLYAEFKYNDEKVILLKHTRQTESAAWPLGRRQILRYSLIN